MLRSTVWAVFSLQTLATGDETSMLQMPVVEKTLQTEDDASECRCPGYFREQCEAEAAQGCVWTDAGSSNGPWCQCRAKLEPGWVPEPEPCCRAMTCDCLACASGVTVEEYCQRNPDTPGCVVAPEPEPCCRAMTADCLACAAGVTVEEYCQDNPDTHGCVVTPICCRAMTADCLACAAGVTVGEYCQSNPDTQGCEPAPAQAHLEPRASNACSPESISEAECLNAVQGLLPEDQAQGRTHLVAGNWAHVPTGCSVQSGGEWAAHFNRRDTGSNDGGYSPVCAGPAPIDGGLIAHLEPEASNACSTATISEEECLEAVRSLLPEDQAQGRTHLVSGSWGHVPVGCSVQSGGDWAAHFNRRASGSNDGGYSPVCTEREPVNQLIAHLEPQASNACSTASMTEAECLEAVVSLLPEGETQGRRNLVDGNWGHVPTGCSVQSGGDWAAHFNRNPSGSNDGGYSPVCTGPAPTDDGIVAHLEPLASNACSTESMSEAECLEAVRSLLPEGRAQGRRHLVAGSWGHVPTGCSVQAGGDWAAHFNRRASGSNDGAYSPVCTGPEATDDGLSAHLGVTASNTCSTESFSEAECLEAARLVLPDGQAQGRTNLVAGSWGHVPPGCSVQSGGDWAAHYNRNGNGLNDGGYSPVCIGPEAVSQLVAHLEPRASNACSTESIAEADCLEAVRSLLPEGFAQGRTHLVAGSWAHVPTGCSVQSGGDWAAHFNRRDTGSNDGGYSPVCDGPAPTDDGLIAHLEPQASNACSTATISEEECLEAVRSLLPEDQAQGRTHLVSGSWGHVPVGCSVQSGGDWAAHFNRRASGRNDGGYSPVCTEREPINQLIAHLEPQASNACSTESMSEAECLEAARSLLPEGATQGRTQLVDGNWNHVPTGCSVQSGGDWAAHFNRRDSGSNDGGYSPVCTGPAPTDEGMVAHLEPLASNACSTESMSEAECLEAVRSLLPEGRAQGRRHLVAGSWGHVPTGCSVQAGGDWAAHFNRRNGGNNDGGYSPVCTGPEPVDQLAAHLEARGSNACTTASLNEAECLEAVVSLLPEGQAQGRRHLVAGSWGHVPAGCSVQSGGDWAAHFNRRGSGNNDGGYSPVCMGS